MCVPKGDSVEYVSMFSSGKCFRSLKLELILEMFCFFFSSLIVTISSYFHKKFLWKGKDKVTRKSAINDYEGGGIKMVICGCVEGIKNFQVYGYIGFQSSQIKV